MKSNILFGNNFINTSVWVFLCSQWLFVGLGWGRQKWRFASCHFGADSLEHEVEK